MLGLFWYLHRRLSRRPARRKEGDGITVLGRQGLGPKAHLFVVQTDDARYVLAVTEQRVEVVDRLPARAGADEAEPRIEAEVAPPRAVRMAGFDYALAAASDANTLEQPYPLRVRQRNDPLRGSILSAQTWRQTAEALRRAR